MAEIEEEEYIPKHINYISLPKDEKLKASYYAYKVSKDTQQLANEQGRSIFAEAIFDGKMQVLSRLCLEVLSRSFGAAKLPPSLSDNSLVLRLYFDALSIDLPLEKIYCIEDVPFWKRVVLKQIENSALRFNKNINWKNKGIAHKLEQILESKPAEFYPDQELIDLAQKIKGFVTEMHIQHLQSLTATTFDKYFKEKESDESSEDENIEDEYDWNYLITSQHDEAHAKVNKTAEDSNLDACESEISLSLKPVDSIIFEIDVINEEIEQYINKNRNFILDLRQKREHDKRLRAEYRIAKQVAEEEKLAAEAKRKLQLKRKAKALREKLKKKGKKSQEVVIPSLFEITLPDNEERILTGCESIEDTRNPDQWLKKLNKYKYPAKHCHHIDLSFLQYFTNLVSLTIEFQGPRSRTEYHTRHYNVSYVDMKNLAKGIESLSKLKIFRLRNSRLDSRKLYSLINVLKNSHTVEVADFGNDFLDDECALPIYIYLQHVNCLKSLELEGNKFGANLLKKLAYGLNQYKNAKLEYLGLARNNIPYAGFHILVKIMCQTNHVKALNLTGARIEDSTVSCCIRELISSHADIESINLLAVPMEYQTSINLQSALRENHKILAFNIRGCGFATEIEFEIEVLLQRNQYLKENPHIGNTSLSEQEAVEILKNKYVISFISLRGL